MMGRTKNKKNSWLPKHVTIKRGLYVYTPYLGCKDGKPVFGPRIQLGREGDPKSLIWERYEEVQGTNTATTLKSIIKEFLKSQQCRALAPRTRRDYERYNEIIINKPLANGKTFGQLIADNVTPGAIRKYLDKRLDEDAPIAGNKEVGLISSAYTWARSRDKVSIVNPCIGVPKNPRNKRQHYVKDSDYYHALFMPGPFYVPFVMEFCYLCRLRENEALSLKRKDIMEDGRLWVKRGKGSKDSIIKGERLDKLLQACSALPLDITPLHKEELPLIHNRRGQAITVGALQSTWKTRMRTLEANGGTRFWLHDLKRKGVSDFAGDKLKASGHRDPKMLEVYDVLPDEVGSTR